MAGSLLSMDQASLLGIIAFVIVVLADTSRLVAIGFGDRFSTSKPTAVPDLSGPWGVLNRREYVVDATMRRVVWGGIGMLVVVVLWGS